MADPDMVAGPMEHDVVDDTDVTHETEDDDPEDRVGGDVAYDLDTDDEGGA